MEGSNPDELVKLADSLGLELDQVMTDSFDLYTRANDGTRHSKIHPQLMTAYYAGKYLEAYKRVTVGDLDLVDVIDWLDGGVDDGTGSVGRV